MDTTDIPRPQWIFSVVVHEQVLRMLKDYEVIPEGHSARCVPFASILCVTAGVLTRG